MSSTTADTSSEDTWAQALEKSKEEYGATPNVLVNVAAVLQNGPLLNVKEDEFARVMAVNVGGPLKGEGGGHRGQADARHAGVCARAAQGKAPRRSGQRLECTSGER